MEFSLVRRQTTGKECGLAKNQIRGCDSKTRAMFSGFLKCYPPFFRRLALLVGLCSYSWLSCADELRSAIAAVAAWADGKHPPELPLGITLNAIIALFTTMTR